MDDAICPDSERQVLTLYGILMYKIQAKVKKTSATGIKKRNAVSLIEPDVNKRGLLCSLSGKAGDSPLSLRDKHVDFFTA